MKIYKALLILTLLTSVCSAQEPKSDVETPARKMDILFIAIDDMNDWTTVFDKNNPIKTPNLERLAARGAFFENAYCASPGCNPSRTAILTGLRPSTSGVYDNPYPWRKILPDAVTLPKYFNQHGYRTRGAGKIFHHARTGEDDPANPSFEEFFKMRGSPRPKIRKGAFGSFDWGPVEEKLTDEFTVEWALERMKVMPRDKPLFLAAGIFHPHLPHFAPPKFFDLYPFDQVVMPPMPPGDLDDVSQLGIDMAHREWRWSGYLFNDPPAEDDPASLKSLVRAYQASSSYADAKIGQLLDQLDATGRAENTIIVLWSDHGYHLGDKESVVKFTLWEKSSHVPFIIVAPGITKPGTRIKAPVGLINIYPTLLDLAGLPAKPDVDSQSLVPLLKDPKAKWAPPAIINQGRGNHAVRSRDWRYIRYKDGTEELYDCKTDDPWNHTNLLAGKDKENYAAVVSEHKKWLPATEAPARDWPKKAPAKKRKKAPVKKKKITQANTSKPSPVEGGGTSSEFIPETPAMPENPPKTWLTYHLAHPAPEFALDPNPAFFWKGRYHLHYIYKNQSGHVFAHVSSEDMVHWEWHPTVLGPTTTGHGMFSGTGFITKDGRAAMTYHGKGSGRNWISYALDDNLDKWSKPHEMTPRDKDGKLMTDMPYFDPDIWINNGIYYGVNGVSSKKPTVMMKSNNLKDWDYIGDFLHPDFDEEKLGVGRDEDISCSNMFRLGDKWVLLCISHKLGCRYFIGDFKDEQFLPEQHGMMNWADRDFFAPESLLTPDGRRVMWAWCTPRGARSSLGKKLRTGIQTGIQSLPRELTLSEDGTLLIKPLRELKKLRSEEKTVADLTVKSDSTHMLEGISGDTMELEIVLEAPTAKEFGITVLCDEKGEEGFTIASGKGSKTLKVSYIDPPFELQDGEDLTLRIFIDKNLIEVFANDRQAAVAWHDYDADNLHVSLFSKGGDLKVKNVSAWQMKSIYPKVVAE